MDRLNELVAPKTFHKVSRVALISWYLIGVMCLGIFSDTENSESSAFNTAADLSLREMLTLSEHSPSDRMDDEVWNYILENPESVLFMFDGIDEFNHNSKIGDENYHPQFRARPDEKMPLFALYEKLATGKLLDGAAVLTTTRSAALSCIERLPFDKVFEIISFSFKQVENYIEKFSEDTHGKETLRRTIWNCKNISSLCYIPGSCFIICSTLFRMVSNNGSQSPRPTQQTDVYKKAVKIFYLRYCKKFRYKNFPREDLESADFPPEVAPEVAETFDKLEKIAFEGIVEGQLKFGGNELRAMEDSPFLHRLPDQQFCFIHSTMREFFAAKHLANMSETRLRYFVSEHIADGKWKLVLQFLAGLMNDGERLPSTIITDLLPLETEEKEDVCYNEEWTEDMEPRKVTCWPTKDRLHLAETLIKCCSENSKMEQIVQRKLQQIYFTCVDILSYQLTPFDCSSLVSVIKNVQNISHLDLSLKRIGQLGCLKICELLKCSNSQLSWLNLSFNQLTDKEAKDLAKAMKNDNCQLRLLNLEGNNIKDEGAQNLANAISNDNCQLRRLFLTSNSITETGAQHLAEAISNDNCQLRTLDLSCNKIEDEGAKHLADAIQRENCQLRILALKRNNITNKGAKHLADATNNESCQRRTYIDLSQNNITAVANERCVIDIPTQ
ncbi:Nucleotide-binding oligomerization domain-containing protein 2 [Stylophora pistillata]|uniref:Nucleotide-binding oligomerization domain-containing protein 2 n=1 Tax=Stylophora pistillata TaxID=50429 RepID=A0A2B4RAV7_STYPI|nr:Nucleotide-binding oligomerization domain-containing protein 2 [Stylophora pistillata]